MCSSKSVPFATAQFCYPQIQASVPDFVFLLWKNFHPSCETKTLMINFSPSIFRIRNEYTFKAHHRYH